MAQLDETITTGDLGHETDHEVLARKANYVFDVKDFGAVGDGSTDDSAAFAACIQTAIAETYHPSISIPAGKFKIVSPNIFSDIDATGQVGLHVEGVGWKSSIISFEPTSTGWLYNNGGTNRLSFMTFANLQLSGDGATGNANGFWLTGGHEQGFNFLNVTMNSFSKGFIMDGTANADAMSFVNCRFNSFYDDFYTLSSSQSVIHTFFGCHWWTMYANLFTVDGDGGGMIHVASSDLVMNSGSTADTYILEATGSSGLGSSNGLFTFRDFKAEFHSDYHKILNLTGTSGEVDVVFDGTRWTDANSTRTVVSLGRSKRVVFRDSQIDGNWQYAFIRDLNGFADDPTAGVVGFENCRLPANISDKFVYTDSYGRAYARDCVVDSDGAGNRDRDAADFDLNWTNSARGDVQPTLKVAVIKAQGDLWPYDAGTEWSLTLPRNSLVRNVFIHKAASGTSTDTYQLHVGTDDKGVTHGSSTSTQQKLLHEITLTNLNYEVGTADNERIVRLWATGGNEAVTNNGYAIVEYL